MHWLPQFIMVISWPITTAIKLSSSQITATGVQTHKKNKPKTSQQGNLCFVLTVNSHFTAPSSLRICELFCTCLFGAAVMNSLMMNCHTKLHITKMDGTGWENEEDLFAQRCGAGTPSGELNTIIGEYVTAFYLAPLLSRNMQNIGGTQALWHVPFPIYLYPFHPI